MSYYSENRERCLTHQREYRKRNREKIAAYLKDYNRRKYRESIKFRLASLLRSRTKDAIAGKFRAGSAIGDLGCTTEQLKEHLESQFQPGMSWENWGLDGWHVDHIKPLNRFDLTDREQFLEAAHYTNLQPLWAYENLVKR